MKYTSKNQHQVFTHEFYSEDKKEYEKGEVPSYHTWVGRMVVQTAENEKMDTILNENPSIDSITLQILMNS